MSSAKDESNASGSHEELIYDPKSGMSQEEFKWRLSQYKMAGQRMPHLLDDLRIHSERMRHHFRDDPDALAKWVRYENEVHAAFESNLKNPIASEFGFVQDSYEGELVQKFGHHVFGGIELQDRWGCCCWSCYRNCCFAWLGGSSRRLAKLLHLSYVSARSPEAHDFHSSSASFRVGCRAC